MFLTNFMSKNSNSNRDMSCDVLDLMHITAPVKGEGLQWLQAPEVCRMKGHCPFRCIMVV